MSIVNSGEGLQPLRIGLGMAWVWRHEPTPAECRNLLEHALQRGIKWFDVSPAYGIAEQCLGDVAGNHPGALRIVGKYYGGKSPHEWTSEGLKAVFDASLTAMRLQRFDAYVLHSPPFGVVESDLFETLIALRDEGLAATVGISADGPVLTRALALHDIGVVETSVNFLDTSSLGPAAIASGNGALVFAKRALANAVWRDRDRQVSGYRAEYALRLRESGGSHSDDEWLDLAVRFATFAPKVDIAFIGTGKKTHLDAIVRAARRGPLPDAVRDGWMEFNASHPEWEAQT